MRAKIIDHNFLSPRVIASYLFESSDGIVLIESGPESTSQNVEKNLERLGLSLGDIKHVFVTHIHLDHSGGAWKYAQNGARVYVHPNGAVHLTAPERLVSSATRVFGDKMKTLWGEVLPVPEDKVRVVNGGDTVSVGNLKIRAFDTPGHAGHHHCYLCEEDGTLFTGDATGVRIEGGAVIPPTPPPEINIELWQETIKTIRGIAPETLCPTHFGPATDVVAHLDELSANLEEFSSWIGEKVESGTSEDEITREFQDILDKRVTESTNGKDLLETYRKTDTVGMNTGGLVRYWKKFRMEN